MRFVRVSDKIIGETIGRPIINNKGQMLIPGDKLITEKIIKRLDRVGIKSVYIHSEVENELDDIIDQETRKKEILVFKDFVLGLQKKVNRSNAGNVNKKIRIHGDLNKHIDSIVTDLMKNVNTSKKMTLVDIKTKKDYIFEHQINVAILSIYLGKKINLNNRKIRKLARAALIYDYGNFLIESNLYLAERKLEEDEKKKLRTHTTIGYEYLRDNTDFTITEILPALEHHERMNGSGYPNGKTEEDIHLFSKIIAITDVYDSLTSDRPHRNAFPQCEAIELLMGSAGTLYDFELTKIFVNNIIPYPKGVKVRLSNNESGFVINQNKSLPLRPKIILTSTRKNAYLDLSKDMNVTIKKVILD